MVDNKGHLLWTKFPPFVSRYKYSFPFLGDGDDGDGISVDDNRVGPLYKHVFPPQLAPHISFIGLNSRVRLIFLLPCLSSIVHWLVTLSMRLWLDVVYFFTTLLSRLFYSHCFNSKATGWPEFYPEGLSSHHKRRWCRMWQHFIWSWNLADAPKDTLTREYSQ